MAASRREVVQDSLMLTLGVGLVYGAIYFILSAVTPISWTLIWQLPLGIVAVGAGLLIYGEAVWRLAKRPRRTATSAVAESK